MKKSLLFGFLALAYLPLLLSTASVGAAERRHANRPHFDAIGHRTKALPKQRRRVVVRDRPYYYHRGMY